MMMYYFFISSTLILMMKNHPSSADILSHDFVRLIELDTLLRNRYMGDFELQRSETAEALSYILNNQLLPGLENALAEFEANIENIGSGACKNEVNNAWTRTSNNTMIISEAIAVKHLVYDKILENIFQIGNRKMNDIQQKTHDIWRKLRACMAQDYPDLCSIQVGDAIKQRMTDSDEDYGKVIEDMGLQMSDLKMSYQENYQKNLNNTIINLQPLIDLMKSCVLRNSI